MIHLTSPTLVESQKTRKVELITLEEEIRSQLNYAQVIRNPEGWFVYAQKRSRIGQVVALTTRSNSSTIGTLSRSCRHVGPGAVATPISSVNSSTVDVPAKAQDRKLLSRCDTTIEKKNLPCHESRCRTREE